MTYHSEFNRKPRATSWLWTACEHCDNAHLVLFDENDEPFADMTLAEDQADTFIAQLYDTFAALQTRKELQ